MPVHDAAHLASLPVELRDLAQAAALLDAASGGLLLTAAGGAALVGAALLPMAAALWDRAHHAREKASDQSPVDHGAGWFWDGITDQQPLPRHGTAMSPQRTRRASGQRLGGWRTTHPAA